MKYVRMLPGLALIFVTACSGGAQQSASLLPSTAFSTSNHRACNDAHCSVKPRDMPAFVNGCAPPSANAPQAQCALIAQPWVDTADLNPDNVNACVNSTKYNLCYGPIGLRNAYAIASSAKNNGVGQTVAVVDFYNDVTAAPDLDKYRSKFNISPCNGCLKIVNEQGAASPLPAVPPSGTNYDLETSLDVQMISAICPNCNILLVEANAPTAGDEIAAVNTAEQADAVSLSWAWDGEPFTQSPFNAHPNSVIVAASGDWGAGCDIGLRGGTAPPACEPCSFKDVVCVGGTTLTPNSYVSRGFDEVVWDGLSNTSNECPSIHGGSTTFSCATGSGCSGQIAKPAWQNDTGCVTRSESDISADADPNSGGVIFSNGAKYVVGGTSMATPIVAAMFALAGNASTLGGTAGKHIWNVAQSTPGAFNAIVNGKNEYGPDGTFVCPSSYVYICKAGTAADGAYSGPAGWGTPSGLGGL